MSAHVAKRYAKALFELAVEQNQFVYVHLALHDFIGLLRRDNDFRALFFSGQVETKIKINILDELLKKDTNTLFFNFLNVLVFKRRSHELFQILDEFERLYDKKQNRLTVNVESAIDVDDSTQNKLYTMLTDILNSNVGVNVKVNPEILGGLIFEVEGTVVDVSLRRKFIELKKRLAAASVLL